MTIELANNITRNNTITLDNTIIQDNTITLDNTITQDITEEEQQQNSGILGVRWKR